MFISDVELEKKLGNLKISIRGSSITFNHHISKFVLPRLLVDTSLEFVNLNGLMIKNIGDFKLLQLNADAYDILDKEQISAMIEYIN
jgi:hypothetical protein